MKLLERKDCILDFLFARHVPPIYQKNLGFWKRLKWKKVEMKRPRPRFWTSSAGFRRLVLGPPLAFGGSFLELLWHRSWTSSIASGAFFFGSCFWSPLASGPGFWTSSGFRGLVFGPPPASGRSFLDLLRLPGARFWTSSCFHGARLRSFLDLLWLPGARFFLLRFWTSSGFRGFFSFLDFVWLPAARFLSNHPLLASLAFVFPFAPRSLNGRLGTSMWHRMAARRSSCAEALGCHV